MIQINDITLTTYRPNPQDARTWIGESQEHRRIWISTENHGSKIAIHCKADDLETAFIVDRQELMTMLRILEVSQQ